MLKVTISFSQLADHTGTWLDDEVRLAVSIMTPYMVSQSAVSFHFFVCMPPTWDLEMYLPKLISIHLYASRYMHKKIYFGIHQDLLTVDVWFSVNCQGIVADFVAHSNL